MFFVESFSFGIWNAVLSLNKKEGKTHGIPEQQGKYVRDFVDARECRTLSMSSFFFACGTFRGSGIIDGGLLESRSEVTFRGEKWIFVVKIY